MKSIVRSVKYFAPDHWLACIRHIHICLTMSISSERKQKKNLFWHLPSTSNAFHQSRNKTWEVVIHQNGWNTRLNSNIPATALATTTPKSQKTTNLIIWNIIRYERKLKCDPLQISREYVQMKHMINLGEYWDMCGEIEYEREGEGDKERNGQIPLECSGLNMSSIHVIYQIKCLLKHRCLWMSTYRQKKKRARGESMDCKCARLFRLKTRITMTAVVQLINHLFRAPNMLQNSKATTFDSF